MIERIFNDRYRLEGRLGEGGMAIVFCGFDTLLRRRVAIKVLRPQFAADEDFVRRFYDEAQHAAKLSHPNVVNIYDVGHEGDTYFIVMELVDGETLAAMLNDGRRLPERVAIDYATQICNGLAYAHRQACSIATSSRRTSSSRKTTSSSSPISASRARSRRRPSRSRSRGS